MEKVLAKAKIQKLKNNRFLHIFAQPAAESIELSSFANYLTNYFQTSEKYFKPSAFSHGKEYLWDNFSIRPTCWNNGSCTIKKGLFYEQK
ncbi:MAG: hypothetical protein H6571_13790 [Lewinellaceae bacterium]|nr:hypothetical protein [Lewinellaceae bacterium]